MATSTNTTTTSTSAVTTGILNTYTIKPRDLTQYAAWRGVVDFSQIAQFNQYETGYSFLSVIQFPKFIETIADEDSDVLKLVNAVKHTMEYEFRGITGIPDINGESQEITDGINSQNVITKVTSDTAITVSMSFYEKQGSPLTKFAEYYLTGIKDRMTQAKHYHGLIKNNKLAPGYENEVFTFLYIVTDNTMYRVEKAYLLCNAQLTKAETSMYESTRGTIEFKELTYEFNCFPVWGYNVDKAASELLSDITGVSVTQDSGGTATYATKTISTANSSISYGSSSTSSNTTSSGTVSSANSNTYNTSKEPAYLNSDDYLWAVMNTNTTDYLSTLTDAISNAESDSESSTSTASAATSTSSTSSSTSSSS